MPSIAQVDSEKVTAAAVAANQAAILYVGESNKVWTGSDIAWKSNLAKLIANMGVAESLARSLPTMSTYTQQRQAIEAIQKVANDASVLLRGAPPSGSTAEATSLADLRLKLEALQKAAAETSKKGGSSGGALAVGLVFCAAVATLFLVTKRD